MDHISSRTRSNRLRRFSAGKRQTTQQIVDKHSATAKRQPAPQIVDKHSAQNAPAQPSKASHQHSFKASASHPKVEVSRFRLLLVWATLMVGGALLAMNLFRLQIVEANKLREQAKEQQMIFLRPFVPRRPIVDRNNNVLAVDQPAYSLFAHPNLFKDTKSAIATQLSPILNRSVPGILQQFERGNSGIRMEYSLDEGAADRIAELRIDGLELIQHQQRLYPQQDLLAGILGYVDVDHEGQAGLEYSQQDLLERSVKTVRLSRMGNGSLMPDQLPGGFLHLDELRLKLTLDSRLQRVAQSALRKQMKLFNAKRGAVVVMDARDGSLLSFATDPSFDPNEYFKAQVERFRNWAITDLYEPGSTFKPINVAIALEAGAIKPDEVLNDEGQIYVDGWPIENFDFSSSGGRGPLSITEIIQYSSNVGMVHIVERMKSETYFNWLKQIGLGKLTGIDLPFEVESQTKTKQQFIESDIEAATASFGQGFSLTPIKLAQLHAALANGGRLVTPYVVQGLYDTDGKQYWQPDRPAPRQVFSPSTTQSVLEMMEAVVAEGTGKPAQIEGYRIAGKTGTAQKANPNGGYYENAKVTSFVSILPVDNPRYVVLAVVDEPQGGDAFGSTVAAPIVKEVMEALIAIAQISPSSTPQPEAEKSEAMGDG
jgi:cell division protein FtsI (penicillin-binding protein 3)